jgi:DNA-binding response OmpR family regulator
LSIDYVRRREAFHGEPVDLTATEYALLYDLAVHARRMLNNGVLLQRVWILERWAMAACCGTW